MLCCVVDSNPYQLSCPGSLVGRAQCHGFESHPRQLFFFSIERALPGVVDRFAFPYLAFLPRYQVVETCKSKLKLAFSRYILKLFWS